MLSTLRVWALVLAILGSLSLVFYFGPQVEHVADIWLIAWWMLLITLVLLGIALRGQPQLPAPKTPLRSIWSASPSMLAVFALFLVPLVGFFVLLWMGTKTWMLFINARFWFVLLGLGSLAVIFSPRAIAALQASHGGMSGWAPWKIRSIFFVTGLFGIWLCWQVANDLFRSRQVIEGTVTSIYRGLTRAFIAEYWVEIDGTKYKALGSAITNIERGDHIRAEVSTGSSYVVTARRLP